MCAMGTKMYSDDEKGVDTKAEAPNGIWYETMEHRIVIDFAIVK